MICGVRNHPSRFCHDDLDEQYEADELPAAARLEKRER